MSEGTIREFVAKQKELLGLEFEADSSPEESKSVEERASHVLASLEVSDVSVGLYGRTVVQMSLLTAERTTSEEVLLPAHRFTVGDEVQIRKQNRKDSPTGVICAVADTFVSVAIFETRNSFQNNNNKKDNNNNNNKKAANKSKKNNEDSQADENDFLSQPPFSLVPMSSVEVHRKMIKALDALEKDGVNHPVCGSVVKAMFDPDLSIKNNKHAANFDAFNDNLDESQMEAISFALHSERKIALIHGPPGTGKTTTVAELIYQAVKVHNMKVLVTAPSNVAVDNILERLVATSNAPQPPAANNKDNRSNPKSQNRSLKALRLGHPARIKASILKYSLEAQVQGADGTEIVKDVRKELQSYLKVLSNPKSRPNDKRAAYREVKTLRKEIRQREEKVVQELIGTAQVVLATTVGAANRRLDKVEGGFDLVIIDEAAQALEASCWIPVLRGKRIVLAGDHCQLPPTIKARQRQAQVGLSKTMFERLMELYGDDQKKGVADPKISRMLQLQYRMHHDIADWASQAMYHGELQTHSSVRDRTLSQLEDLQKVASHGSSGSMDEMAKTRMLLVDTAGCEYFETVNAAGSRLNHGEANIVTKHVQRLIQMGLDQSQLAIITPYNGQVELLRSMLLQDYPRLEIRTVDGFQGGEREAVILSLVRSSDRGGKDGIGFLKDDRRQNVAITRAKRHLAVVCDTETVCQSKFIKNLIDWVETNGETRSAIEYAAGGDENDDYEADLRLAEAALLQMVESEVRSTEKSKTKSIEQKKEEKKKEDEIRRKALMDQISKFAEFGPLGKEMKLSTELSSYERMLVHELAEQLGLGHRSEGTEGVDRRIILSIVRKQGPEESKATSKAGGGKANDDAIDEGISANTATGPSFAALAIDDSDSESGDDEEANEPSKDQEAMATSTSDSQGNSLLAQLAKERAERQQNQGGSQATGVQKQQGGTKKKKKSKGQKLGGKKPVKQEPEESLDDLDDMAFLDAQIVKAENSHGRKVEGKGQYRTIVNGILNTRPEPRAKPTNPNANAALKSKLKDAQNARKAKPKKKKK